MYNCLHAHSYFSLLDGLSSPEQMAERYAKIGSTAGALTDHGSVSGHIEFLKEMKKKELKPLLGIEQYICDQPANEKNKDNRNKHHMVTIAKNDDGWQDMMQLVSEANLVDNFYYKPRLSLDESAAYTSRGNMMGFSGHIGSHLSNILFLDREKLDPDWKKKACYLAERLQNDFGKGNFFIEVQMMDNKAFPLQKVIAECMREVSQATGIPKVATPDAHYAEKIDAQDQRILLCANMGTTLRRANNPEFGLYGFFRSSQYHIPSYEEMSQWHSQDELENTLLFAEQVSPYERILKNPILPHFSCPTGYDEVTYLRELCRRGWEQKIKGKIPKHRHQEYADRVKMELDVFEEFGLSAYFLIVADILEFVNGKGWLPGPGRGSAGGCLVSYLINITQVDPIQYGLKFERFLNKGRMSKDHISLPDIDVDVPKYSREHVIAYIRNKYGADRVGQMVTFHTLNGRGAMKAVFRAHANLSDPEMNEVTKNIIEKNKITDELQQMEEDTGSASILRWCLENTPRKLEQWCRLEDDGTLTGPLAREFAQGMRLEGVKTTQSKHAAGIVVADRPLSQLCPMVLDKTLNKPVAGFEMGPLEAVGGLKLDILGLVALDKLMGVSQDLEFGEIRPIPPLEEINV